MPFETIANEVSVPANICFSYNGHAYGSEQRYHVIDKLDATESSSGIVVGKLVDKLLSDTRASAAKRKIDKITINERYKYST
jgi:hypothetical protein